MDLKTPPHSQKAEEALLGSVLLDPECADNLSIRPKDFFDIRNSLLWEHIQWMRSEGVTVDSITIAESLVSTKKLDKVGGYDRLVELQDVAIVPSHSQHYEGIVVDASKLRSEINILNKGLTCAYEGESPADEVISSLMSGGTDEVITIEDIIEQWHEAAKGNYTTIPTPYPDLDRMTGGIRCGVPTVFTGRSKAGKSMFLAMWYNFLGRKGIPVMVLPFEDGYDITITRMAANLGRYKWGKIDGGGEWTFHGGNREWVTVTQKELKYAEDCLRKVQSYPVHFHDGSMYPSELMGVAARFKRKHGTKAFFVDGAKDFLKPSGKYNDVGFDEECSQIIKHTCKKLKMAGVVVHHLTKIPDHELISMINIRGSANIVGDSRSVYALQSMGLKEDGVQVQEDEMGRLTTRAFECLGGNHGSTGRKILDSDLSKVQFFEVE